MSRLALVTAMVAAWASAARAAPASQGTAAPRGASVLTTRHDFSVRGPGAARSATETQVCFFCHLDHGAGAMAGGVGPDPGYVPYNSSTLVSAQPGAPSGATRLCLSCHDGTIAPASVSGTALAGARIAAANLGTDLRTTHPVSFVPAAAPGLKTPPPEDAVKLDRRGQVQCTSCHDPHLDLEGEDGGDFLVKTTRGSALCLTCHAPRFWLSNPSAHQASTKAFDRRRGATTPWATVTENGCSSCHRSHGAATTSRLLVDGGPDVCRKCHAGQVAALDVDADLRKAWAHPVVQGDPSRHDAAEALPEESAGQPRHAQCVDCHDPHAAFGRRETAPRAGGALSGVWGIDRSGARVDPVKYEYEVCFKCHGDSANQPQRNGPAPPETVRREVIDANLRRRFDLGAASFHPIEGSGRNADVPSLVPPLDERSVIYCSDCHASDASPAAGGAGPRGPHGSIYPHILARSFTTADGTPESEVAYALCYGCHDREVLLSDRSGFIEHARHVRDERTPCSGCHDWHGVSTLQGNQTNNAHLIDFDVSIVERDRRGRREYASVGWRTGRCSLRCHGVEHDAVVYGATRPPSVLPTSRSSLPRR